MNKTSKNLPQVNYADSALSPSIVIGGEKARKMKNEKNKDVPRHLWIRQGCTNCGSLAAGLRGNGERMRK